MTRGCELVGGGAERVRVDVGEDDRRAGFGERPGGGEAHAGAGTGDESDLAGEVVGRDSCARPTSTVTSRPSSCSSWSSAAS